MNQTQKKVIIQTLQDELKELRLEFRFLANKIYGIDLIVKQIFPLENDLTYINEAMQDLESVFNGTPQKRMNYILELMEGLEGPKGICIDFIDLDEDISDLVNKNFIELL